MAQSSKGIEVDLTCVTEYKDYVYNENHEIWSLITLKAPCVEVDQVERPPIDLVAVIDVSGSMCGPKLDLVKMSLKFVLTQLNEKDRLALVSYDSKVTRNFGLKNMNDCNKEEALKDAESLCSGSMTNLCGGLMKGLDEINKRGKSAKNDIATVLLFTDGIANVGITSSKGIVAAMGKKMQPFSMKTSCFMPFGRVMGKKPSVSDLEDKPEGTVYTFGFGDDHQPAILTEISDAGNGMYYFIQCEDQIVESFGHWLGGIMSTLAQHITVEITAAEGVSLPQIHTARPVKRIGNSVKINMGDMQSEESRDIVLELTIDKVNSTYTATPQTLFDVRCEYFNVVSSNIQNVSKKLTVLRPDSTETHDETTANPELNAERERVEIKKVMENARAIADQGELDKAKDVIDIYKSKLENLKENFASSHYAQSKLGCLQEDLVMYNEQLSSIDAWENKGRKLHMNLVQQNLAQRSCNLDSNAFQTKQKKHRRAMAISFSRK